VIFVLVWGFLLSASCYLVILELVNKILEFINGKIYSQLMEETLKWDFLQKKEENGKY
jgi:hypothetical protein